MGFRKPKLSVEPKLRPLDQYSFSSQFFFLSFLGLSGNMFVIIGVMVIIQTNANPFIDIDMLILLLINQMIIYLLEGLCIYLRRKLKIWEDPSIKVVDSRLP